MSEEISEAAATSPEFDPIAVGRELERWTSTFELEVVALAVFAVALTYVARRPLASILLSGLSFILNKLAADLSKEVRDKLAEPTQVLLVTLVLYVATDVLNPPDLLRHFLVRLLASVAVIAVFSAWYRLASAFVSILRGEGVGAHLRLGRDWTVRVTEFAVLLFGITALLRVWEIDISGALTGVGVLGAGLAIALQDLVRNLIAGMTNASEERFVPGDAVHVEGLVTGVIKRVDLRSTLIVGYDQIPRYVPNAELSNGVVLNRSRMEHRRVMVTIGLVLSANQAQVANVRDLLERHLRESGDFDTSEDAPMYVRVSGLSAHAIEILFYGRTRTGAFRDYLEVSERLTFRILSAVNEAGTALAYPTQTIEAAPQSK
ncbi:mechanosensitive ion channel family protein [Seohaeicola saemankumensis]|nr:mechanosensitive ion channel family protein [Seohaeicola saemankumensis]MCA0871464.1 mechanosensitive ion channel family protein [Seohaeicola saemankumensis]